MMHDAPCMGGTHDALDDPADCCQWRAWASPVLAGDAFGLHAFMHACMGGTHAWEAHTHDPMTHLTTRRAAASPWAWRAY